METNSGKDRKYWGIVRFLFFSSFSSFIIHHSSFSYAQPAKVQLDNGLVLIHCEKKNTGLVSANLFVKDGSSIESDNEAGVTSIMLQLLTKGTIDRTSEKIANDAEMLGATISAGCSNDFSNVSMIVPSENFVSAFDIFADIVNQPTFPSQEFEKEKTKTLAAIKAKADNIFSVAYDYFNELIFSGNPYHKPIEGYETSVSSLTVTLISDTYRGHFKTENMVLCVVGDIGFDVTEKLAKKYFGNIKIISESKNVVTSVKAISKQSKKIYSGKFQQAYIFSGFLAPSINQNEYVTMKVINAVLGGGMGSRLFETLREKSGLVYEGDSFYSSRKQTSDFVLYAGTSKKNVETVEDIFTGEIKKLSNVSADELKNAKEYLKGVYLLDHRTIEKQSWYLGWWEIMGKGYEYDGHYLEDIDKVSVSDIRAVCEKYFDLSKKTVVILK